MRSLKLLGLGALLATAFVAGCPGEGSTDGDTLYNYLRGTAAADTLDWNNGNNAWPAPRMFVGSNGEVVLPFQNSFFYSNSDPSNGWTNMNFYRVLGGEAGAIREVDFFAADWNYDSGYEAGTHSYNKRYEVGLNSDDYDRAFLVAYDSADLAFGMPLSIFHDWDYDLGYVNDFGGLVVDNTGLASVFLEAEGNFWTAGGEDDADEIWVLQADMNTNTIVTPWTIANAPFASDLDGNDGQNECSLVDDPRIAVNGDIMLLVDFYDDYDGTSSQDYRDTLESIYFDVSANTWTQSRIDTNDDGGGDPYEGWFWPSLDTDGESFQVAYIDYSDWTISTSTDYHIFTTRVVAGAATSFPTADFVDLTDFDGGGTEYVTTNWFPEILFGRDGSSIVMWSENDDETNGFDVSSAWFSWSNTTTAPDTTQSFRGVDVVDGSDDGYDVQDMWAYFQDDGSMAVVSQYLNNDDTNSWERDEELFIGTYDSATNTYNQPTASDNLADEDAATGTDEARNIWDWDAAGYSTGSAPTLVVAWHVQFEDITTDAEDVHYHFSAVLVNDLTVGTPQTGIEDNTTYEVSDWWIFSTNDIKTGGSYDDQIDFLIDPDTLPAVGNGVVWIVFIQVVPSATDSGNRRALAWNFNPVTQTALNNLTRDIVGWDGDVSWIESVNPTTGGAASVFINYLGESIRCNLTPSVNGTTAGTSDNGVDVTPVDMVQGENQFHCDGMSWKWSQTGATITRTFQGGSRIWSIWDGHDYLSERLFGKRTR